MAVSYASVTDLEARWRPLTDTEKATAEVLLGDASALIRVEVPDLVGRLFADPPTIDEDVLRLVACAMVKRAMLAGSTADGVSQQSQTAGPFSQQFTYANPMGNLYLTKAERKLLGAGAQSAFTVDMGPSGEVPGLPLNWWELNL